MKNYFELVMLSWTMLSSVHRRAQGVAIWSAIHLDEQSIMILETNMQSIVQQITMSTIHTKCPFIKST